MRLKIISSFLVVTMLLTSCGESTIPAVVGRGAVQGIIVCAQRLLITPDTDISICLLEQALNFGKDVVLANVDNALEEIAGQGTPDVEEALAQALGVDASGDAGREELETRLSARVESLDAPNYAEL